MKKAVKKVIAYSLVVLLQAGLFASASEAAARYIVPVQTPNMQKLDNHKIQTEKDRHEKEMKRRPNESDREWKKRQQQEQQRHERALQEIQGRK